MSPAIQIHRVPWFVAGCLLIGSALLGAVAQPAIPAMQVLRVISIVLSAAALLVFAFGTGRSTSVTARRPFGTGALTLLALWVLVYDVLASGPIRPVINVEFLLTLVYFDLIVRIGAALIAVAAIARAKVVPAPWNWAPAGALAVLLSAGALTQVLLVAVPAQAQSMATTTYALNTFIALLVPTALGVISMLLAVSRYGGRHG